MHIVTSPEHAKFWTDSFKASVEAILPQKAAIGKKYMDMHESILTHKVGEAGVDPRLGVDVAARVDEGPLYEEFQQQPGDEYDFGLMRKCMVFLSFFDEIC